MRYAHHDAAEWIDRNCKRKCSPLGRRAAYIIGVAMRGVYNAPIRHDDVDWSHEENIQVTMSSSSAMATTDHDYLTKIVLLAHELCVRVSVSTVLMAHKIDVEGQILRSAVIEPEHARPRWAHVVCAHMRLTFTQRDPSSTSMMTGHPTIEQAVARFRDGFDDFARALATGETLPDLFAEVDRENAA